MNQQQIADVLNITDRQVRNLTKKGILVRSEDGDYDVKANVLRYTNFKDNRYAYRLPEPEMEFDDIDEMVLNDLEAEIQHNKAVALFNEAWRRLNKTMTIKDFTFTDKSVSKKQAQADIITSNTVNGTLALVLKELCAAFPSEQWPLLIEIVEGEMHDKALLQETFDDY